MKVNLDFETRSMLDLKKVGAHAYARHASTEVLCVAYSIDDGPIKTWVRGAYWDRDFQIALGDPHCEWVAWNAQFERLIMRHVLLAHSQHWMPGLDQWTCSMARAAAYGLPLGLDGAARALRLSEAKDKQGAALMRRMTKPRGYRDDGSPIWIEDPESLARLAEYCAQDVRVEMEVASRLQPLPESERRMYVMDQTINDRGVAVDLSLAHRCRRLAERSLAIADAELRQITNGAVSGVTKVQALTRWVRAQGVEVTSLAKGAIQELQAGELPNDVSEALQVRQEAAKSSVKKLESLINYATATGRAHGLLQYHGAATGRWAGRGPQPQNFPRGTYLDAELLIPLIGHPDDVSLVPLIAPTMEVLSSLLRGILVSIPGKKLVAGDYAAIEARVLAWIANQEDLLELFRLRKDVYKRMAMRVYDVPEAQVTKGQRQMGKQAILGLGYQMGEKTFRTTCAGYGIDVTEEFAGEVVRIYRNDNRRIVALWSELEQAARLAVETPGARIKAARGRISFQVVNGWLELTLPSGRKLRYGSPRIASVKTPWGEMKPAVVCDVFSSQTNHWGPRAFYGGLWTENIVQAIARDIMADAMSRLENEGYFVILTVHDEIVTEVPDLPEYSVERFEGIMRVVQPWAFGCPIDVEAWEGDRYHK